MADSFWAKDYIEILAAKHLTTGIDANNFGPHKEVTRAEFAAFLVRALEIPTGQYKGKFIDVAQDAWYAPEVEAANEAGLVLGVGNGMFNPNANISREEMAVMIMRAYAYVMNKNIKEEIKDSTVRFVDIETASDWAIEAITAAQATGIIKGINVSGGLAFAPKDSAIRAHAAAVIIRFLEVIGRI